jgi:ubiquinol-cytochrome c reductase iron-sulfur subunit
MAESTGFTRRHFLTVATVAVGGAGAVATAMPFVASFRPSARAQALGAPIQVDVSKLEPGQLLKIEWRGRAVYVVHRDQRMLQTLDDVASQLADPTSDESIQPSYASGKTRSIRPEYLVIEGVCTLLGCAPVNRFEVGPADLGPDWRGGFYCPCHGSKFDLAGRVYAGVPAPTNLVVPPHTFINASTILIGSDMGSS